MNVNRFHVDCTDGVKETDFWEAVNHRAHAFPSHTWETRGHLLGVSMDVVYGRLVRNQIGPLTPKATPDLCA